MPDARIGGEQLPILARPGQVDGGIRKAALGGVQDHAGDRDIGAQRHAREHEDAARPAFHGARNAHAAIAFDKRGALAWRDGFGEQRGVDVAQGWFETIGQAFGDYAEERL